MKLERLTVENMRNIAAAGFEPDPGLTVIAGKNGQGKTNLLECIWLLTGSKSFRGSKDVDLVRRNQAFGRVTGQITGETRPASLEVVASVGGKKRGRFAKVNGVDYGRAAATAGIFTAVVFDPGHLSLIKAGPEGRRKFVDAALCQLYPGYLAILRRFSRALAQKNALLKQANATRDAHSLLDVFDTELVASGSEITRRRAEYLDAAGPDAENYYQEISNGAETMKLRFKPSYTLAEGPEALEALMKRTRHTDLRLGFCTAGPQREDFEVLLDGVSARTFASQGQQRSVVLSLKLAEAARVLAVSGQHPVLLLDDVLSELDPDRQAYLLSRMEGKQSFVTACDEAVFYNAAGKILRVENGEIISC